MGILAPVIAGITAVLGSVGSAVGGGLASLSAATGIGTTAAAGAGAAAAGTAAAGATTGTILGGITAASTIAAGAVSVDSLLKGAPKPPDLPATPAAAPTPPSGIAPAGGTNRNTSLAALSPGLALSGTSQFLGGGSSGAQKSLLGQ